MKKKYNYPFTLPIGDNINIHIEHIDESVSCIWFDNNDKEEQNIPDDFGVYNGKNKLIKPFRNTQSYAVAKTGNYTILYNNITITLTTEILLCIPAIVKNEITVIYSESNDNDSDNDY